MPTSSDPKLKVFCEFHLGLRKKKKPKKKYFSYTVGCFQQRHLQLPAIFSQGVDDFIYRATRGMDKKLDPDVHFLSGVPDQNIEFYRETVKPDPTAPSRQIDFDAISRTLALDLPSDGSFSKEDAIRLAHRLVGFQLDMMEFSEDVDASFREVWKQQRAPAEKDISVRYLLAGASSLKKADTTAPLVLITQPPFGATISDTVEIEVVAWDDRGVTELRVSIDDGTSFIEKGSTGRFSWNTASIEHGELQLRAFALDAAANRGAATAIKVTVDNRPPLLIMSVDDLPDTIAAPDILVVRARVENEGVRNAENYLATVEWTPKQRLHFESGFDESQKLSLVAPGAVETVEWKLGLQEEGGVTVIITLRDETGRIVERVGQRIFVVVPSLITEDPL